MIIKGIYNDFITIMAQEEIEIEVDDNATSAEIQNKIIETFRKKVEEKYGYVDCNEDGLFVEGELI
jgi:hypothetical protein